MERRGVDEGSRHLATAGPTTRRRRRTHAYSCSTSRDVATTASRHTGPAVRSSYVRKSDVAVHDYTPGCKGFLVTCMQKPPPGH